MKGKLLFVVGLGAGYVLGTRAGRERYEQIKRAAEGVWNQPTVQRGVDQVKDFAKSKAGDVSGTVLDNVKAFVQNATKQAPDAKVSVRKAADATKRGVDTAADAVEDAIDEGVEAADRATTRGASPSSAGSRTTRTVKPASDS